MKKCEDTRPAFREKCQARSPLHTSFHQATVFELPEDLVAVGPPNAAKHAGPFSESPNLTPRSGSTSSLGEAEITRRQGHVVVTEPAEAFTVGCGSTKVRDLSGGDHAKSTRDLGSVQHENRVYAVALDRHGSRLFVGGRDKRVIMYNVDEEMRPLWQCSCVEFVYTVALSPDGAYCAFGGPSQCVEVLDARSGDALFTVKSTGTVWSVCLADQAEASPHIHGDPLHAETNAAPVARQCSGVEASAPRRSPRDSSMLAAPSATSVPAGRRSSIEGTPEGDAPKKCRTLLAFGGAARTIRVFDVETREEV